MRYTVDQHVFIVENFFSNACEIIATRNVFNERFPDEPIPSKSAIHRLIKKFRETGSVNDKKHRRSRSVFRTIANIDVATLQRVANNAVKRAQACIEEGGGHFQHLL